MPGSKQAWPATAACWSPATPVIGRLAPSTARGTEAKWPALSRTSGSIACGTRRWPSKASSQRCARRSKSRVRDALVASVACTLPPLKRQRRKVSMVPKASRPRSARARAPAT